MRGAVAIVALALLPVVGAASPDVGAQETPGGTPPTGSTHPHLFIPDEDGLVTNRRPSNVAHLGVGPGGVIRAEDSREATAGYDGGFDLQPEDDTMQGVNTLTQWDPSQHQGEVVDTSVGFLTDLASPDMVVLRGASRRWSDPGPNPAPTTLTWYGSQRHAFAEGIDIDLTGVVGSPVGGWRSSTARTGRWSRPHRTGCA